MKRSFGGLVLLILGLVFSVHAQTDTNAPTLLYPLVSRSAFAGAQPMEFHWLQAAERRLEL